MFWFMSLSEQSVFDELHKILDFVIVVQVIKC